MAEAGGGERGGAPAWLFSFVDLAFLMLIAMTIVANQNAEAPDLGEIVVPRVDEKSREDLGAGTSDVWQLRVHPPVEGADGALEPPFELVPGAARGLAGGAASDGAAPGRRLDRIELGRRLAALEAEDGAKPLLAPHEDSRSQDLLDAASLVEELWPSRRGAVVARRTGG